MGQKENIISLDSVWFSEGVPHIGDVAQTFPELSPFSFALTAFRCNIMPGKIWELSGFSARCNMLHFGAVR